MSTDPEDAVHEHVMAALKAVNQLHEDWNDPQTHRYLTENLTKIGLAASGLTYLFGKVNSASTTPIVVKGPKLRLVRGR